MISLALDEAKWPLNLGKKWVWEDNGGAQIPTSSRCPGLHTHTGAGQAGWLPALGAAPSPGPPRWHRLSVPEAYPGSSAKSQGTGWGPDRASKKSDQGSHASPLFPPTPLGLTWGMMVIRDRSVCSPTWAMGTPSIHTLPSAASKSRSRPPTSEDFPAPVLPTMPTCEERGGKAHCGQI